MSRHGWSKAICRKSISVGENRELIGKRDKVSTTAFCSPEMSDIVGKLQKQLQSGEFREEKTFWLRMQCKSKRMVIGVDHKLPAV